MHQFKIIEFQHKKLTHAIVQQFNLVHFTTENIAGCKMLENKMMRGTFVTLGRMTMLQGRG